MGGAAPTTASERSEGHRPTSSTVWRKGTHSLVRAMPPLPPYCDADCVSRSRLYRSEAAREGLCSGDVLLAVNGKELDYESCAEVLGMMAGPCHVITSRAHVTDDLKKHAKKLNSIVRHLGGVACAAGPEFGDAGW